jgi:alpha-tubulin suppressor-like RCC1 family protein
MRAGIGLLLLGFTTTAAGCRLRQNLPPHPDSDGGDGALASVPLGPAGLGAPEAGRPADGIVGTGALDGASVISAQDGSSLSTFQGDSAPPCADGGCVLPRATHVAMGRQHACALLATGSIVCWGNNDYGQLGDGSNKSSDLPVAVLDIRDAIAVKAGENYSCALASGGTVQCWGKNSFGELGSAATRSTAITTPVVIAGLGGVTAISCARFHACALVSGGEPRCWGWNHNGQLGDGTTTPSSTPVTVSGIENATAIVAGASFSCALASDGRVLCWGGQPYMTTVPGMVTRVAGISDARGLAAGDAHACVLLSDGRVRCWGRNLNGQLGNGTTIDSDTPVDVNPLPAATFIAAGSAETCAFASGSVRCWGDNRLSPVPVSSLSTVTEVAMEALHGCALTEGGSVWQWDWRTLAAAPAPGWP